MKAKDFEQICLHRLQKEEAAGRATMSRYGVQGSFRKGEPIDVSRYRELLAREKTIDGIDRVLNQVARAGADSGDGWHPLQSLPDFEGIILGGFQFIFDCKVCGQASFPLDEDKFKKRQLRHMLTRSRFGAICFLLIYFTERELAKSIEPAQTWAFPISGNHPFWMAFDRGEVKRITRADCQEYAAFVPWNISQGGRTERPDILAAVHQLS